VHCELYVADWTEGQSFRRCMSAVRHLRDGTATPKEVSLCVSLSLLLSLSLPLSLTSFWFICQSACISLILSLFLSLCPLSESLSCSRPLILHRHIYICTHLHLQSWSFLGVQGNGDVEVLKRFAGVTKCAMDLTYSTATGCVC
jgi:hypothetical protein